MDGLLEELMTLHRQKSADRTMAATKKQLAICKKIRECFDTDLEAAKQIILSIKRHDSEQAYNMTREHVDELLAKRMLEKDIVRLFPDEIRIFRETLGELEAALIAEQSIGSISPHDLDHEETHIRKLSTVHASIIYAHDTLKDYLSDLDRLVYDKRALRTGSTITKLIGKSAYTFHLTGIENIPLTGPLIIVAKKTPQSMSALTITIPRDIHVLTNEESISPIPHTSSILRKAGIIPYDTTLDLIKEKLSSIRAKPGAESSTSVIRRVLTYLKYEHLLVMYPEEGESAPDLKAFDPHLNFIAFAALFTQQSGIPVPIIAAGIHPQGRDIHLRYCEPFILDSELLKTPFSQIRGDLEKEGLRIYQRMRELSQ